MKINQKTKTLFTVLIFFAACLFSFERNFGSTRFDKHYKDTKMQTKDLPKRIFGLTVDTIAKASDKKLRKAVEDIRGRGGKIFIRIVFDFDAGVFNPPKQTYVKTDFLPEAKAYKDFIERNGLRKNAFIMGEIADSGAVYLCRTAADSAACMAARTEAYAEVLNGLVDIWEIGNEVNGEWVGWYEKAWEDKNITVEQMQTARLLTAKEISAAHAALKRNPKTAADPTAITFYYNDDTVNHGWTDDKKRNAQNKMIAYGENYSIINWLREQESLLPKADYIFLSYYEDDNAGVLPRRGNMDLSGLGKNFKAINRVFPAAKIGFGEFGAQCSSDKPRRTPECQTDQVEHINRYYQTLDAAIRQEMARPQNDWGRFDFVGGYFYWHFSKDVVKNKNKPTEDALKNSFADWNRAK